MLNTLLNYKIMKTRKSILSLEQMRLYNKAFKCMPGSKQQKAITKQIDALSVKPAKPLN